MLRAAGTLRAERAGFAGRSLVQSTNRTDGTSEIAVTRTVRERRIPAQSSTGSSVARTLVAGGRVVASGGVVAGGGVVVAGSIGRNAWQACTG